MVTIYVGPKRKEFVIHKKLLCNSATFFHAAFTSGFAETKDGIMFLPDDDPGAFALYIRWIYCGTVEEGHTESYVHSLYHLYFLAEKVCLVELKDRVLDSIQDMAQKHDLTDQLFTKDLVEGVCQQLPPKWEGLRKFCIGMMVLVHRRRWERDPDKRSDFGEYDKEADVAHVKLVDQKFVWEVSKGSFDFFRTYQDRILRLAKTKTINLYDPRGGKEGAPKDRCLYHCHVEGWDCRAYLIKPKRDFIADMTRAT